MLFPLVKKRHCPQTLTEHTSRTYNETLQKINQEANLLLRNKEETAQSVQKHQQYTPEVRLLWEDGQRPREKTGKKHFLLSKMDHVP